MRRAYLFFAIVLFLPGCASKQPGAPIKPGINLFSKEQDIQLGRQAAQEVVQQLDIVRDQALQDYVRRIGQRLAQTEPARSSGFPFEFTVVNDKSINAFALPGGPMFIFTGLMAAADTEGELVGVMGHEMAHVILRHGTNQVSKANLLQLPAQIGAVVADQRVGGGQLGQLAQLGVALGLNSLLLKFSRTAETQADVMGARIMAEAGYNPIDMARFFEKLEAEGGRQGPEFFSDHPNPGNRRERIEKEIQVMPQRTYDAASSEFAPMKTALNRLPAPRPPQQQQRAAAPRVEQSPSQQWRQVQGPGYQIAMPEGWNIVQGQGTSTAAIAPRGGLVRDLNGGISIGYGVLLGYYSPQRSSNLAGASQELWEQIRSANPSIELTNRARGVTVSGSRGLMAAYQGRSAYGGVERGLLVTVGRPEGLFYMVATAPEQANPQLTATLEQVLGSMRFTR